MNLKKIAIPNFSLKGLKTKIESIDRKVLIQNLIMVGGFLIFIFFFFLPLFLYNQKMARDLNLLKDKVVRATAKIARIPEMTRQKEMFGTKIKKTREQFFELEEADHLIEIVSNIAADSGVRISASRPAAKSLELPPPFSIMYATLSYELAVEGPYHNLGTFINRLERGSKNISVHTLEITAGDRVPTIHQSTLVLTAFLKRGKQNEPKMFMPV
ncbi:MAG: type 4a pilus biogenesis protein PilO [Candidatus Omnitrophica bacterium]|nr:type 4a pilus biogenesis protein PilO [Candidatus Omnitrophota bacterium]